MNKLTLQTSSLLFQLKMRTGGVDSSRISKRKRSPKPRNKRTHQQPSTQLQEKPTTVSPVPEVAETPAAPAATEGFEHITCERLATTPAGGEAGGVVDIEKSFEVSPGTVEPLIKECGRGYPSFEADGEIEMMEFEGPTLLLRLQERLR